MKATTSTSMHNPQQIQVHFDRELPIFLHRDIAWTKNIVFDRSAPVGRLADYSARRSQGRIAVEMVSLRDTIFELLTDLFFLRGVESIANSTRYSLSVNVGSCFDATTVAEGVARIVHQHLYGSEPFVFLPKQTASEDNEIAHDNQAA